MSGARLADCATGFHDRCLHPERCGCPCHVKAAAPGPQQPDEVRDLADALDHDALLCRGAADYSAARAYEDAAERLRALPAAPSAQPDEVQVSEADALSFLSALYGLGHAYPRPGQTRQQMSEESVALVRRFVADHTPAQPVRDTGETP